jgi:hypothetical protein
MPLKFESHILEESTTLIIKRKDMQSFQNPVAQAQTDNILTLEPASPSPRPKQQNVLGYRHSPLSEKVLALLAEGETSMREVSLEEETPLKDSTPEPFYRCLLRRCLMTDALSMRANRATVLVTGMCVASMMYDITMD